MKIRTRAYLLGLMPALLVAAILGTYLSMSRLDELDASLKERGGALARYLAQGAEYAVASGNVEALHRLLTWTVQEHEVVYAGVYRPDGEPIDEAGRMPQDLHVPLRAGMTDTKRGMVFSVPVVLTPLVVEDPFLQDQAVAPSRPIAWVQVSISHEGNTAIAQRMLLATLGITALGLMFAMVLVRGLALMGIRPLMEIIAAVRGIASGNFQVRLPHSAKSELGELQRGINQMSEVLQSFQEEMQRRVDAATSELAKQKEAAERANQAKSKFLAAASHDLRQPMHAIALYVASMKPQVAKREAAITLGKIEAAVAAMEDLFSAILDVSKLDAGVIVPERALLSVKSLLDGFHEDFRQEAEAKGLGLSVRCGKDFVASDPVLLGRIMRNLISNALRYTEQGRVLIAARRRGEVIRFQVWDTGPGIPPEQQEAIFQEFVQLANPQRDRSQGLGLGLAIVDRLAHLLGHPLTLCSMPGKGTVFSLDVPASRSDALQEAGGKEGMEELTRLHGLVAVVDDDEMVVDSLATLLRGWGLRVVAASSGAELLARLKQAPDILITDYRLVREDGLEVAQAVRMAYPGSGFRLIVVTGDTSGRGMRALSDSGYHVLHKPVRPARLRALLSRLIRSAGSAGGR